MQKANRKVSVPNEGVLSHSTDIAVGSIVTKVASVRGKVLEYNACVRSAVAQFYMHAIIGRALEGHLPQEGLKCPPQPGLSNDETDGWEMIRILVDIETGAIVRSQERCEKRLDLDG